MTNDNYIENLEISRDFFNEKMIPIFQELEIMGKPFMFKVCGTVSFSFLCKDSLKEIDKDEEIKSKDSIKSIGEDGSLIRKLLVGASYYGITVSNPEVTHIHLFDDNTENGEKCHLAIEKYIDECSENGSRLFYASNYNADDLKIGYSESPVSVSYGEKIIERSNMLMEEIPVGTNVELVMSYGQPLSERENKTLWGVSIFDEVSDSNRFLLRAVKILDDNYFLDERPSIETAKEIIKNNNETISALLNDNDRVISQLGKTIGLFDRESVFHLDKDSQIEIPANSFPKTVFYDEDMKLIEDFFSNPKDEEERKVFESTLETINSSIKMIDLYKFILSFFELPSDIKIQTAKACYIEWQSIVETLISLVVDKIRETCLDRTSRDGDGSCDICREGCNCERYQLKRKNCRYNIQKGKFRNHLEKFQSPDVNIKRTGDEVTSRTEVNDHNSRPKFKDKDLLNIEKSVYEELIVAYGVRNIFVHIITSRMSEEHKAEIDKLETDPCATLDRLEQNCKKLIKGLSNNVIGALKQGKCLREYIEHTDR